MTAFHSADLRERLPSSAQLIHSRPTPAALDFSPAATLRPQQDMVVHGFVSSKSTLPTKSQPQRQSTCSSPQNSLLLLSTSASGCRGETPAETLTPTEPAATAFLAVQSTASKTAAARISAGRTVKKVQRTFAERSLCAHRSLSPLSYRFFLVILWFVLKGCEKCYYCRIPHPVSTMPRDFSSSAYWTHSPPGCTTLKDTSRCYNSQVNTQPLFSVVPTRWEETTHAETATARTIEADVNSTPVLSTVIQLAAGTLFPEIGPLRSFRAFTRVPVFLSVAASLLFQAYGADVLVPAGRTAIGRSKNGAANGPAATLGVAGTERTAAAPTAAGPALNEAAGGGGRREKRGGGAGEAAKTGGYNNVVVARGAGDGTAVVAAAVGTSMTTQEEGFARDSYWARSLRRRWGEQAYLDMVARTINGLESEHFWLAMLGKQLQLQSSKMHLKTQRIERHKLEQRRKKQAMAAFNQAQGKAEAAAAEFQRHQRRAGGGAAAVGGVGISNYLRAGGVAGVPAPRLYTGGAGGAKSEAELRFGELSLYTLDWVGPRTCAQLGWAAGNDVCALSLEIEIHVLHSRLLLKSVEVQDRQNRLFVCDTGAAFFRASAAALAKQEGSERQFYNTGAGSRNGKNCIGCDNRGAESTVGSTTTTTVRGRDKSKDMKGGAPHSPHTATTGAASIGAMPEAPLAFWDDQGGNGDEWTHGGGSRVGATGAAPVGGSKERRTTGMGADKRRANRAPAGGGIGAAGAHSASSPSPGRPQLTAGEKAGKKAQQHQHHGGGADGEEKLQHHHVFSRGGEDGSAAGGERRTGGTTKKRRRPNKRKKKISSHNKNVAASLGTLHETFDWEAIAHSFYIPALADLQPPGRSMVESFTTELAYLMGVLDREESLRSGKPTVVATSLPHDQYRSTFAYSSMPLTGQALGVDRAGAERFQGQNILPGAGGGQIRRTSPVDRKRTAAGGVPWAVDNWARDKPLGSAQGMLGAAPAAAPLGTTNHSAAGNRLQIPNVPQLTSVAGPLPESSVKKRPRNLHVERHEEKGREPAENAKDKRRFPLVRVASPSQVPPKLSAPLLHTQEEPGQKQQPQTYPWRPAIPRSTRTQPANPRQDPSKTRQATVLPTQQAQTQQQGHAADGVGKLRTSGAYVRDGERASVPLPEVRDGGSVAVRNQNWWSQLAAGAKVEEEMRQPVGKVEAEAKNYTRAELEPKNQ